jgi:uncharacterized protein (DUF433 family)
MGTVRDRSDPAVIERYGGADPLLKPIYSVGDVAHHLRLPTSTVRSWVRAPANVIVPADGKGSMLSFQNLTEVHVLSALRAYKIPLRKICRAIAFLRDELNTDHPLAEVELETDRREIFALVLGTLVCVSGNPLQGELRPVLEKYLERVERDHGHLLRLYPLVDGDERTIAIDPLRRSGAPYLVGVGVETSAIASRFKAGEKIKELAKDYDATPAQITEALRYERALAA